MTVTNSHVASADWACRERQMAFAFEQGENDEGGWPVPAFRGGRVRANARSGQC